MMIRRLPALLVTALLATGCERGTTEPAWIEAGAAAGTWKTWVIGNPAILRPGPPPSATSEQTRAEIEEILRVQGSGPQLTALEPAKWNVQPTLPWTHEALDLLEFYWFLLPDVRIASPARSARIMALLHVAMYDALVATWEAKYTYNRPPPYEADSRVRALTGKTEVPSYPSEHAAAAAAAVEVLAYAFPQVDRAQFEALAKKVGDARLAAGVAYRSDLEAGAQLGREVARRALIRAMSDGSAEAWQGSIPEESWAWRPTPPRRVRAPFDPTAGSWKTWVIPSGDAMRLPPPPMPGSVTFERDLAELRQMPVTRTLQQANAARYWATDAPTAWWDLFMEEEIRSRNLPPVHAARAQALLSVAMYDAFVAGWDSKYHYWILRPITADPSLQTVFSTPPFPSYPSGHSTVSGAAAEVFAYLFPDAEAKYRAKAQEASYSRIWAGVHYRFDAESGKALGKKVGEAVVAHARADGAGR